MIETTAVEEAGCGLAADGRPYTAARRLAGLPFRQAVASLRSALISTPDHPDLNALRLWLALRRHRARPATIGAVNRLLATVPLLKGRLTADNAFEACVKARQAAMAQTDPGRFFRFATVSHACGMMAFWRRYGGALEVEHLGDRYALRVGDRRLVYAVAGPQLGVHFDFFFVHEPGMWAWLAELTADDVLLDIGANVGIYSVAAARLRGCRVVGLEPFPVNLAAAVANVEANGVGDRVRLLPVAATATSGRGRLSHHDAIPGIADQAFHAASEAAPAGTSEMAIEGVAVDDLVGDGAIPFPSHVKIDVDGGEDGVIRGMRRTLADPRLRSVMLEVRWWEEGKRAVVDAVSRHGFHPRVSDDRKNLVFHRRGAAG